MCPSSFLSRGSRTRRPSPAGGSAFVAAVLTAAVAGSGGCAAPVPADQAGIATLALIAPPEIRCVRLTFTGPTRAVVKEVVPDDRVVSRLDGLPTGAVRLTGAAFAGACGDGEPAWLSEPVAVMLGAGRATEVTMIFRPNGIVEVTSVFEDDAPDGGIPPAPPPVPSPDAGGPPAPPPAPSPDAGAPPAPPPTPPPQSTLTVTIRGAGRVVINDSIVCTSTCTNQLPARSKVNLVAAPTGTAFASWSGDCQAAGTNRSCDLLLDGSKNAIATFGATTPPPPPDPVVVASLSTANFGPVAVPIPVAGAHTLSVSVRVGMAQGWVVLSRLDGQLWTEIARAQCTSSGSFTTCQNAVPVTLSTASQYRWDFHMVSLPSTSETQGGEAQLTRP